MHESQYLGTLWILICHRKLHWEITKLYQKWKRKISDYKFTTNSFFRLSWDSISTGFYRHICVFFSLKGKYKSLSSSKGLGWPHIEMFRQNLPNYCWDFMTSDWIEENKERWGSNWDIGSHRGNRPVDTKVPLCPQETQTLDFPPRRQGKSSYLHPCLPPMHVGTTVSGLISWKKGIMVGASQCYTASCSSNFHIFTNHLRFC